MYWNHIFQVGKMWKFEKIVKLPVVFFKKFLWVSINFKYPKERSCIYKWCFIQKLSKLIKSCWKIGDCLTKWPNHFKTSLLMTNFSSKKFLATKKFSFSYICEKSCTQKKKAVTTTWANQVSSKKKKFKSS
jgi:hypothetical protein